MRSDIPLPGRSLLFPFLIAVGCHLLGAFVLVFGWQQASSLSAERLPPRVNPEDIISAVAVQNDPIESLRQQQAEKAAAAARAKAEQQRRQAEQREKARQQALIRQKEKEEAERQKALEEKRQQEARKREAERKAAEEAKRQAELKRQQQLKEEQARKAREEAERKRREAAAKAKQAAAEAAERKRQEALAAEQRSLQAALDQEEAFLSQLEDRERLASMQSLIKAYVEQNWSRPPTARKGMQAVLRIELLPTGEVKSVSVSESSDDLAFDRSAEQAVYRAGPFRELQELKPHQRDAFRSFNMVFKPEDIQ